MNDKKNRVLITVVVACWAFMLWWWFSSGGFLGLTVSVLVGAIAGGIAWFVVGILT